MILAAARGLFFSASNRQSRTRTADVAAILMAAALPWSTTIFGIVAFAWIIVLATIIKPHQFASLLRYPRCTLPVALFILAVFGMLWSDSSWQARIHAAATLSKLLAIPALVYQFERSQNGSKVLFAFLGSCTALLALSWLNWLEPRTVLFSSSVLGVPVKNWITQGVEFVLCVFGSAALAIFMWRACRPYASFGFALLAIVFLLNITFVASSSRTSVVSLPILLIAATFRYIGWRRALTLYVMAAAIIGVAWATSPTLKTRLESLQSQYARYTNGGELTSVGLRIEYWKKSIKLIRDAPLTGHGTGSIRDLFVHAAGGKTIRANEIVANPHNQTLYFAIEWGLIGVTLLYCMWIAHFSTFTESRWISWIGMLVVVQNIFDSLFNSHLSDYVEGWIYVMGVGVAAGMISKTSNPLPATAPARSHWHREAGSGASTGS